MPRRVLVTACSLLALAVVPSAAAAAITAPQGVRVTTVARGLGQPANLTFDPAGGLWTTSTSYANRVHRRERLLVPAQPDRQRRHPGLAGAHGRGLPGPRRVFARGFTKHDPVGAAIGPGGALYVTLLNSGKVVRFTPPR